MTDGFTFNAQQYFDFNQDQDDQNADAFFDVAEECVPADTNGHGKHYEDVREGDIHELSFNESECFFSPNDNFCVGTDNPTIHLKATLRKSLSMSHLPTEKSPELKNLDQALNEMALEENFPPRPNSSASSYDRSSKTASKEHINRLAQPKRFNSRDDLTKPPPMTLAEAVNRFQSGTPKRFRSKPSFKINKVASKPLSGTKAHTPKLMTTNRTRPVTALSKDELEKQEIEEAKKFKIKANPLNRRILKGPLKPQIEKKPATEVQPFHLTEVRKKHEVVEEKKVPQFKAQPLPKSLHNPFKPHLNGQPATRGQSPNFSKRLSRMTPDKNVQIDKKDGSNCKTQKLTSTQPVPFSFEKRDQEILKKKQEQINRVLEEEKRAREFHAKPIPKAILKSKICSQDRISEIGSLKSQKSTDEADVPIFKARPASVLHMKPFEPKKDESHFVKIEAFQLTTDQRLEARKTFEEKLREKEALAEAHKRHQEEVKKILEEQEVNKLRQQMEFKAQPIKKYKEITIVPANRVTEPKSPKFHTGKIRNKENIQY